MLPTETTARRSTPQELEAIVVRTLTWRLVPFLFLLYIVAYLDRINLGFAALQMQQQLGFNDAVYGFEGEALERSRAFSLLFLLRISCLRRATIAQMKLYLSAYRLMLGRFTLALALPAQHSWYRMLKVCGGCWKCSRT